MNFNLYPFQVGEIITMKKNHPCGSKEWVIRKVSAEVTIECLQCGHIQKMTRRKLESVSRQIRMIDSENE